MNRARALEAPAALNEVTATGESGVIPAGPASRTRSASRALHETLDLVVSLRFDASLVQTLLARGALDTQAGAALRSIVETSQRLEQLVQQTVSGNPLVASERMASIGMLAIGVAHEINNPLSALMAHLDLMSEILTRSGAPVAEPHARVDELLDSLSESRRTAEQIRQIVRDLSFLSRSDDQRPAPVAVHRVLDSVVRMAWHQIRLRARLVKEYGDVPLVAGSETRVAQVFLNVLVNAAQAVEEGAPDANEIRIVTATGSSGEAVVEIHDTGCGISSENLERVFEHFFTTKPPGVGTGLGLPMCRQILAAMGGRIGITSSLGAGSVVRIELPAVEEESADLGPLDFKPRG